MKRLYAYFAVFLFLSATLLSQTPPKVLSPQDLTGMLKAPSNAGTEFYFSFPPCIEPESTGINTRCCVYVTSSVAQSITIEVPGSNWQATKSVLPNVTVEFNIPPTVAQAYFMRGTVAAPIEKVYQRAAVHLKAQSPVVVNAATRYGADSDGFLVLPVSSLGLEYVVSSWPQIVSSNSYNAVSETTISAVYDETVVQFEMGGNSASATSGGLKSGQMATFTMNKGDVLCFASNGENQDISGSYIKSTKPVAVVSGNQCANVPVGIPNCDYISEMELPISTWGREYHVTPIYGRKKNSMIRIFAKEKNTTVYRDGQSWLVIPRSSRKIDNGYIERRLDDGASRCAVISADKPIYVVQYNTSQSDYNVFSDPFQMALTPIEQYQNEIMFSTPGTYPGTDNFKVHYMNLVYQLGPGGSVPDDLEFAVVNLKVENIVILGHRQCGGIRALMSSKPMESNSFIGPWMDIAAEARITVLKQHPNGDEDTLWRAGEMESIKVSMKNLLTFPFVKEAVEAKKLNILGLYFDIERGELWQYDESSQIFKILVL